MKKIVFPILLLSVLVLPCCQQEKKLPENYETEVCDELSQLTSKYFEAWENGDLDSTMTFFDERFINMFSFGPSQTKEECRESFKNVIDTYSIEDVEYERVECIVDKNYAFETGLFKQKWITHDKQDTILFDMRGITVYKLQEDGSWKIFRLIAQQ